MLFQGCVVDSIDNSAFEPATIIHDMITPIPECFRKFDFIFDGGCIGHIFSAPQVLENIINMLEVGGIFLSVTSNNNQSGHGFYQFSPEYFMRAFAEKYGMKVEALYLAELDTDIPTWIDVNNLDVRNEASFNNMKGVYIITIARKILLNRSSLLTDAPQQKVYEEIEWK